MLLLTWAGLTEFYDIVAKRDLVCFKPWGILGGLLLIAGTFLALTGVLPVHRHLEAVAEVDVYHCSTGLLYQAAVLRHHAKHLGTLPELPLGLYKSTIHKLEHY